MVLNKNINKLNKYFGISLPLWMDSRKTLFVFSFFPTERGEKKLVGGSISSLPTRPVLNTVQVYQSAQTTGLIRLHSATVA